MRCTQNDCTTLQLPQQNQLGDIDVAGSDQADQESKRAERRYDLTEQCASHSL